MRIWWNNYHWSSYDNTIIIWQYDDQKMAIWLSCEYDDTSPGSKLLYSGNERRCHYAFAWQKTIVYSIDSIDAYR